MSARYRIVFLADVKGLSWSVSSYDLRCVGVASLKVMRYRSLIVLKDGGSVFGAPLLFHSFRGRIHIGFIQVRLVFRLSMVFLIGIRVILSPLYSAIYLNSLTNLQVFPLSYGSKVGSPVSRWSMFNVFVPLLLYIYRGLLLISCD